MTDAWDDDGDNNSAASDGWDVDSDEEEEDEQLNQRLGKLASKGGGTTTSKFNHGTTDATQQQQQQRVLYDEEEEEDLAIKERAESASRDHVSLKKKGTALLQKKAAEAQRLEEEEIARKAVEIELQHEEEMTPEQRRLLAQSRVEDADHALTNDLFGGVDSRGGGATVSSPSSGAAAAADTIVLTTMKDHLKHARKVGQALKENGKVHFATAFLKEVIQECKEILDDDAASDLIKSLNVIKNDKVAAAKKKVKGQAQKAKRDKTAEAKARKLQEEVFGDNDQYDRFDELGDQYEDDFF